MNKSSKYFLYAGLFLVLLINAGTASADTTLTPGEVQLSVAGILLDVEGSASALDEISFSGTSFDIILNSGQSVTFSSTDRRQFSFSPSSASSYITRTCTSAKSSIAFNSSGLSSPLTITITPESSTCSTGDGGGGIVTGNIIGYNFGPTPAAPTVPALITPVPLTPVLPFEPAPTVKVTITAPEDTAEAPSITVAPYEPGSPVYIPTQVVTPSATGTALSAVGDFILLYWPLLLVILISLTLFGVFLFIILRE